MPHFLQLAACVLLTATTALAQFHVPQLSHKKKDSREAPNEAAWLAPYANPTPTGRESELVHDVRFKPFVRDHFTAPQIFWNDNESLADTILEFLGVPNEVVLDDNRYLSAEGCVPNFCPARGLLFIDLGAIHPLMVFAAVDWIKDNKATSQSGAEYTLWLFCNRPLRATIPDSASPQGLSSFAVGGRPASASSNLDTDSTSTHIPAALKRAIARWTAQPVPGTELVENITNTVLVDPDGSPHPVPPASVGVTAATTQPITTEMKK